MADAGRMLIVDDDPAVLDVLTDYFVDRGYAVSTAPDGQAALTVFSRERPNVVLLDVRMPGLDGLTVLKRLREADPDVAIIMVTANEDVDLARQTLAVGAFDYVAKPFDFEHLDRTVMTAALLSARPVLEEAADVWAQFVLEVFRAVRGMDRAARASTGTRLEDAALAAARSALAGRTGEAIAQLAELKLLVRVTGRLGDLGGVGRSIIDAALEGVHAALPPR